jgi:hypothetical protein
MVLIGCADLSSIKIELDYPKRIEAGEKFDVFCALNNTSSEEHQLVAIDIGDDLLLGFTILNSTPDFNESYHVPIDNSVSHEFNLNMKPQEKLEILFECQALSEGDYKDEIDFCIDSESNFLSKYVRIVID